MRGSAATCRNGGATPKRLPRQQLKCAIACCAAAGHRSLTNPRGGGVVPYLLALPGPRLRPLVLSAAAAAGERLRSAAAAAGLLRSCNPRAFMPGLLEQLQRPILGRIVAGFAAPVVSQRFLEIRRLRRRKRSRQTRTTFSATACCFLPGPGDLHRLQRRLSSMRTARVSYPSLRRPLRWPCRRRRLRARSLFGSLTGSRLVVSRGTS